MARLGADPEQLNEAAALLKRRASHIQSMASDLDGHIRSTWWVGAYSDDFRRSWYRSGRRNMQQAAESLYEMAGVLRRQAAEQRAASDASTLTPVGAKPLHKASKGHQAIPEFPTYEVLGVGKTFLSTLGMLDDAKVVRDAMFYALMVRGPWSLTNLGMRLHEGDTASKAFRYFRGAKGGFTKALNSMPKFDKVGGLFNAGIEGTFLLSSLHKHGFHSSQFAGDLFDGGISSVVGFVPGGGLAYEGGKVAGDFIYHHTPVGEAMLAAHDATDHANAAEVLNSEADAALAARDFDRAAQLNERARQEAEESMRQANGFTGLGNSIKSLFGR